MIILVNDHRVSPASGLTPTRLTTDNRQRCQSVVAQCCPLMIIKPFRQQLVRDDLLHVSQALPDREWRQHTHVDVRCCRLLVRIVRRVIPDSGLAAWLGAPA
jgi:hypothetical protein